VQLKPPPDAAPSSSKSIPSSDLALQHLPVQPSHIAPRSNKTFSLEPKNEAAKSPADVSVDNDAGWDGWPDGDFERDFDWDLLKQTNSLQVHWACRINGGDRKGEELADTWERGKRATRRCLGVIYCDAEDCKVIVRPQTRAQGIGNQLLERCKCGAKLHHHDCGLVSVLWKYKHGMHYSNGGQHSHPRPTHILHLLPNERARFDMIVATNPKVGALGLLVGVPGLHHPGESVAEISDALLNADRIRKERQRVKKGESKGGDGFVAEFSKFTDEHPNFVILSQIGTVTVITMQSPFMASQLVKNGVLEGPVNGLLSDAAHGFWSDRNALLIITSCHSPLLFCWVPGIFSYSNGSSAEHYKLHFLALFQSIAREAGNRGVEVKDDMFAGVSSATSAITRNCNDHIYLFFRLWTSVKQNVLGLVLHLSNFGSFDPKTHEATRSCKKLLKSFLKDALSTSVLVLQESRRSAA